MLQRLTFFPMFSLHFTLCHSFRYTVNYVAIALLFDGLQIYNIFPFMLLSY